MKPLFAYLLSAVLFPIVVLTGSAFRCRHNHDVKEDNNGFAVVELFTSEGCSSCPPADEAVAQLLQSHPDKVYVLGFHVDYWNNLGWKDIYSDAAYSKRQQHYGAAFALNSIYTPQVVVNGKTEFVGSDKTRLRSTVEKELKQNVSLSLQINAKSDDGKNVVVSYKLDPSSTGTLNIALVQPHVESKIQRGENSGKLLHHINVVRDFKTIPAKGSKEDIILTIPAGLNKNDCRIIAFTQEINSLKITEAVETGVL